MTSGSIGHCIRRPGRYSPDGRPDEARLRLREALEIARGQASPALELRTAVSFASSFGHDSPTGAARAMVGNAYATFTEGFETHDLATARELLTRLSSKTSQDAPRRSRRNLNTRGDRERSNEA